MPNRRSGFTLIELLVVIAVIGVLIALLVPAVQKVRESANRATCTNNLKQIGLALLQNHDARRSFPAAKTKTPKCSWVPAMLPYLEQQDLFNRYQFKLDWTDPKNKAVVATPLPVFQCPSAPGPRVDIKYKSKPACGDYNAMTDVSRKLALLGVVSPTGDLRGVMISNETTRIRDITDGTSNTILVAEDAGRPDVWNAGIRVNGSASPGAAWAAPQGPFGLNGASQDGAIHNGYCPMNCTNDNEIYSFHSGGANAVFADGSVHFLDASINIRTMAALVTRAGGEPIPSDFK